MKKNRHIGSSFDDFLKEEVIRDEAMVHAVKRVLAWHRKRQLSSSAKIRWQSA